MSPPTSYYPWRTLSVRDFAFQDSRVSPWVALSFNFTDAITSRRPRVSGHCTHEVVAPDMVRRLRPGRHARFVVQLRTDRADFVAMRRLRRRMPGHRFSIPGASLPQQHFDLLRVASVHLACPPRLCADCDFRLQSPHARLPTSSIRILQDYNNYQLLYYIRLYSY